MPTPIYAAAGPKYNVLSCPAATSFPCTLLGTPMTADMIACLFPVGV